MPDISDFSSSLPTTPEVMLIMSLKPGPGNKFFDFDFGVQKMEQKDFRYKGSAKWLVLYMKSLRAG